MKRVGILTAGGDSPALNAAIRGFGKTAIGHYGMELIGFRDGITGLVQNRHVHAGRHGAVRASSPSAARSWAQPGQGAQDPVDGETRRHGADGRGELRGGRPGRAHHARRRRHRQERAAAAGGGAATCSPAEDDRQRHREHRHQLRLRDGDGDRDRGDRPRAQHRAQPPPDHPHRGHGPPGRLADPRRRARRRGGRHPHPGDPLHRRQRRRDDQGADRARAARSASSPSPRGRATSTTRPTTRPPSCWRGTPRPPRRSGPPRRTCAHVEDSQREHTFTPRPRSWRRRPGWSRG